LDSLSALIVIKNSILDAGTALVEDTSIKVPLAVELLTILGSRLKLDIVERVVVLKLIIVVVWVHSVAQRLRVLHEIVDRALILVQQISRFRLLTQCVIGFGALVQEDWITDWSLSLSLERRQVLKMIVTA
jgi:hypothetical protein